LKKKTVAELLVKFELEYKRHPQGRAQMIYRRQSPLKFSTTWRPSTKTWKLYDYKHVYDPII